MRHIALVNWTKAAPRLFINIPLIRRNCYYFLKLLAMDTDKASNNKLKEEVKANAAGLSFYEAFLEAGPQFILQLSIIIRVGYYSKSAKIQSCCSRSRINSWEGLHTSGEKSGLKKTAK